MPFYELVAIIKHQKDYAPIRELAKLTALHIMDHGGHVRNFESWGTQVFNEPMTRHKITFRHGDYFTCQFDCSPQTLQSLEDFYRKDSRVIRATNIKLGENIKRIAKHPNKTVGWGSDPNSKPTTRPLLMEQDRITRLNRSTGALAYIPASLENPKASKPSLLSSVLASNTPITDDRAPGRTLPPQSGLNENAARSGRDAGIKNVVKGARDAMRVNPSVSQSVADLFTPRPSVKYR